MIPEDEDDDDLLEEEESSSDDEKEGDDSSSSPDEGVQQVPSFETAGESKAPHQLIDTSGSSIGSDNSNPPLDDTSTSSANDPDPVVDVDPPRIIQEDYTSDESSSSETITPNDSFDFRYTTEQTLNLSDLPEDKKDSQPVDVKDRPVAQDVPSLPTSGEKPSREQDAANLGPMSYYKRKNIDKGRGDKIPGLEVGEDGKYRQAGNLNSGKERDEEGLEQQRQIPTEQLQPKSGGPLAVDMMPDIIPEWGTDGASSFKPDGQDSNTMRGDVESAADAIDTVSSSIVDVLTRLTINMKKTNDRVRQLMDKLEVEDHRDEF